MPFETLTHTSIGCLRLPAIPINDAISHRDGKVTAICFISICRHWSVAFVEQSAIGRPCQKSADALLVSKPGSAGAPSGFGAEAKPARDYRLIPLPDPSQNHLAAFWQCRRNSGFMFRADHGCRRCREAPLRAGGGSLRGKFDTLLYTQKVIPPADKNPCIFGLHGAAARCCMVVSPVPPLSFLWNIAGFSRFRPIFACKIAKMGVF